MRVLVIEDSPADFLLLQRLLRKEGVAAECVHIESWQQLDAALAEKSWDIVLADYNVPGMEFADRMQRLRDHDAALPVILVSSSIGDAKAVEALRIGAFDFVLKNELVRLIPAIERALRERADANARRQIERELQVHRQHLEMLVAERTSELRRSEERLQMILATIADGIVEIDAQSRVTYCNAAAASMLGSTVEALVGRNFHTAVHRECVDGTRDAANPCPILQALLAKQAVRVERDLFWRSDGVALPVSVSVNPLVRTGQSLGAVVAFSDATLRQRTEDTLQQARTTAENLARMKSEFLANMSHEIRTPLNGVLGLAQVGQLSSDGQPELQGYFDKILSSGRLLLGVINDILDFSKIEAGKLRIEQKPMNPGALIADAVATLHTMAEAKGIALRLTIAPDLPDSCIGDSLRTEQVLMNLLSNAVKFTERGTVTASAHLDDGWLRFVVQDTGVGMSESHLERMFLAFEQADGSTTRRFGGTGLGLSITRRLVGLMGGEIHVKSELGKGSCFEVRLPYMPAAAPAMASAASARAAQRQRRLEGMRILVADDNPISQFVIQQMLHLEGAEGVAVDNGEAAVAEATRTPDAWSCVLMDVHMPVMDGLTATRLLKTRVPSLPVIGQTADALQEDRDACLEAGMVDQITKPVDHETLVAAILRNVVPAGSHR